MDISSVAGAILRRWYVFLLVVGLAGYAAVGAYREARPTYTSSVVIAVLPSTDLLRVRAASAAGESSLGNPFGSTATTVLSALLADQINTGGIALPVEAGDASVGVLATSQDLRSFFTVQAVSSSPDATLAALDAVTAQSPSVLASTQLAAGSPGDQLYTTLQARNATAPTVDYPDRSRAAVGIALAGLLLAALLCVLVDSLIGARRRRRAERGGHGADQRASARGRVAGPDAGDGGGALAGDTPVTR